MDDRYELERFVAAQDAHGTYEQALAELRAGRKTGHWMWFVFPQIAGLGYSAMSQVYAIKSLDEARSYLAHPVLGPRLRECAEALLTHAPGRSASEPSASGRSASGRSAEQVLGEIDAMKLRSSATLFLRADPEETVFARVLDAFFGGAPDRETDSRV